MAVLALETLKGVRCPPDAVRWSEDNRIAVTTHDAIHVYTLISCEPGATAIRCVHTTAGAGTVGDRGRPTAHFRAAEWSPPGLLPGGACALATLSTCGTLRLWSPRDAMQRYSWRLCAALDTAAVALSWTPRTGNAQAFVVFGTPDGVLAAVAVSASDEGALAFADAATQLHKGPARVTAIAWRPIEGGDGTLQCAVGHADGSVYVVSCGFDGDNATPGNAECVLRADGMATTRLVSVLEPEGMRLLASKADYVLRIGTQVEQLPLYNSEGQPSHGVLTGIACYMGREVVACSVEGTAAMTRAGHGTHACEIPPLSSPAHVAQAKITPGTAAFVGLASSPSGLLLAAAFEIKFSKEAYVQLQIASSVPGAVVLDVLNQLPNRGFCAAFDALELALAYIQKEAKAAASSNGTTTALSSGNRGPMAEGIVRLLVSKLAAAEQNGATGESVAFARMTLRLRASLSEPPASLDTAQAIVARHRVRRALSALHAHPGPLSVHECESAALVAESLEAMGNVDAAERVCAQLSGSAWGEGRARCRICGQEYTMSSSLDEARCDAGHTLPRCAATFQAVVSPFVRTCTRCSAKTLSKHCAEASSAWLRELVASTTDCPHCGGALMASFAPGDAAH